MTWQDMIWHTCLSHRSSFNSFDAEVFEEMPWLDMTRHDKILHDKIWHDMTWYDLTRHDKIWHDTLACLIDVHLTLLTPRSLKRCSNSFSKAPRVGWPAKEDMRWLELMRHAMTCHAIDLNMIWHDMTWLWHGMIGHMKWPDLTWNDKKWPYLIWPAKKYE